MTPLQQTLATAGFELHRKRTRRDVSRTNGQVVPWVKLCELIEPVYPKGEGAGRPTVGLERMLRIYFLQQWFNLTDPAVEESLRSANFGCEQGVRLDVSGLNPSPQSHLVHRCIARQPFVADVIESTDRLPSFPM